MHGRFFIALVSGALLSAGVAPSASAQADCTPAAFPGSPVVKVNQRSDALQITESDVAYNEVDDEFLFVWAGYTGIVDSNDVWGQLASPRRGLIGSTIDIAGGGASQIEASVVFNSTDRQYLVTWRYADGDPGSPGFNNAYGRVLNADGSGFTDETQLCDAGLDASLAYAPGANEYALLARNFQGTGGIEGIKAQRIGADGAPLGPTQVVETAGAPAPAGVILHNSNDETYLVTWRDQAFFSEDLRGRMLQSDLSPIAPPFVISNVRPLDGGAGDFDAARDRFLVVFSTFPEGPLYAQFLDGDGSLSGTRIELEGTETRKLVEAAYNPTSDTYLVVWSDVDAFTVDAQLIDAADGSRLGGQVRVVDTGALGPVRLAADPVTGGYMLTWTDTHPVTGETPVVLAAVVDVRDGADFAEPYGSITPEDAALYLETWSSGSLLADLAEPYGVLDQADAQAFAASYQACR